MNLAQEVNILLDDLSAELKKDKSDKSKITDIKNELNNKTKNGNRCRDLFTNPYYVNNLLIDKETNKVSESPYVLYTFLVYFSLKSTLS